MFNFYPSIKPQKAKFYAVQNLKFIRFGLACYFKVTKGLKIIKVPPFVKCNELFKGVTVQSKKNGKEVRKYPRITEIDLEGISEYFNYDHIIYPDREDYNVTYCFILYTTSATEEGNICIQIGYQGYLQNYHRKWREAVHNPRHWWMWYNHGPDDIDLTNQGCTYSNEGEKLHTQTDSKPKNCSKFT